LIRIDPRTNWQGPLDVGAVPVIAADDRSEDGEADNTGGLQLRCVGVPGGDVLIAFHELI
jgi:hypothetical protein